MIQNLRDVGETVNILSGKEIMPEKMLYRGGSVNELFDESELPPVKTILNLRTGKDQIFPSIRLIHIPAVDSVENYQTANGKVKNWANRVLSEIDTTEIYPMLIHCTAGKDRTGVIIALILSVIGIDKAIIIEEYLQSDGVESSTNIEIALNGIGDPSSFIYDVNVIQRLKKQLIG